jgi:hypothetical protein
MKGELLCRIQLLLRIFNICYATLHLIYLRVTISRVSLEVMEDGVTPKSTSESWNDHLPKLYIHHSAFMKVLGGTLDVDFDSESGHLTPKLVDREGHEIDPNA